MLRLRVHIQCFVVSRRQGLLGPAIARKSATTSSNNQSNWILSISKFHNSASHFYQSDTKVEDQGSSDFSSISKGEYYYKQAKYYLEQYDRYLQIQEEENRKQQYGGETKKSGIAVIKTIARQTRSQSKQQNAISHQDKKYDATTQQSMDVGNNMKTTDFIKEAHKCMQVAAFVYGHNDAIVSLANEALSKSQVDADTEYKYILEQETIINMNDIKACGERSGAHLAMKLYEYAGERGSKEAWFNLGHLLWTGHDGNECDKISPDPDMAIDAFQKAIDLGDDDARYFLAVHYLGQESEATNDQTEVRRHGLKLVQEAADNGHVGALYYLALMYRNGDEELEINPCFILFREYLDEAADNGDSDALFLRAHCLFHGADGYDMDKSKSLEGFIASGEAGNADGFVSAGAIYHHGCEQVKKDQRKAFQLYQQAGEMGSIEGWKNVVACYLLGEGVPKCEKTAQYIQKTILQQVGK